MKSHSDVLVIGGGIIGAACAHELAERGKSVVLIDRGEIGHGCSYGNAGWVTPCFAMPLPMPGMLLKSIGWLLDPASPLYIQPRPSWGLICWLTRFLFSMNRQAMNQSITALAGLAKYSLEAYRRMDAGRPGSFGFTQKGLLMVTATQDGLDSCRQSVELMARHGIPGRGLDAGQVGEMEPAIIRETILGGVYFPEEAHAEPLAAVNALIEGAVKHGATILPRTEVFDFICRDQRIESVRTTHGSMTADEIVLATGSWSPNQARSLDLRLPVLAGKGYAVVVEPFEPAPTIPIMLIEKKIAITPRGHSVRLSGTLELVGIDESITARRVDAIISGARAMLHVPLEPKVIEVWCGLRPCTPDGVPIIGRPSNLSNLVVATGHQMIGLLTAPGTGRLVADIICGKDPLFDLHPFRATRF